MVTDPSMYILRKDENVQKIGAEHGTNEHVLPSFKTYLTTSVEVEAGKAREIIRTSVTP